MNNTCCLNSNNCHYTIVFISGRDSEAERRLPLHEPVPSCARAPVVGAPLAYHLLARDADIAVNKQRDSRAGTALLRALARERCTQEHTGVHRFCVETLAVARRHPSEGEPRSQLA